MFQLSRRGITKYDDLLRELEQIEQNLLTIDSSMAMDLMVLETKIRERFQRFELQLREKFDLEEDIDPDVDAIVKDVRDLIPQELSGLSMLQLKEKRRAKHVIKAAAGIAVITATGVFALSWLIQVALKYMV